MLGAALAVRLLGAGDRHEDRRNRCGSHARGDAARAVIFQWMKHVDFDADIAPFRLAVSEDELDDLRSRLRATRWPERETDPRQGAALDELQALCAYWADGYDWRRAESRLNAAGQFGTTIDGLGIHFLHARSDVEDALPLILTHGWPGSVIEFLDVLEPLTEAGFHCVVPSLPGYGWSDKPAEPGWGVERV